MNQDLVAFFPDLRDTQLPEKEFMYGIVSTVMPEAVRELVASGMKNRTPFAQDDKSHLVEIVEEFKDQILNLYSMKSK